MPKLSAYVGAPPPGATAASPAAHHQAAAAAATDPPLATQQEQQQLQHLPSQQAQFAASQSGGSRRGNTSHQEQHETAAAKLQADYAKRLREHGPRSFRWPDGSLRPDRPPPNPHAVANRQQWAGLVQHCRTHGGDRGYERHCHSLRHGLGVDHTQHAAYLRSIGLEPETAADGRFVGAVSGLPAPLADPEHCFNTYYKEEAEAVFKGKLGRLL